MKARELAAKFGYEIGCIDNSCWFGRPGGMGTNGGCRCWPRAGVATLSDDELFEMRRLVRDLAAILSAVAKGDTE